MAYVNIPASTGNISINVPSSQGRININTASKSDTTNVSLQDVQSFAINKAKDWAEKMDGPIGNEGYSAKWHATEAQGHAEKAKEYSTEIIDLKDSMLQELIAIKEEVIENENITIIGENIEDINITAENIEAIKDASLLKENLDKVSENLPAIEVNAENIDDIKANAENIDKIKDTAVLLEHVEKKSMPVGTIYQAIRTDIPEGSLRLDGTEFTTGFDEFVANYLATGKIIAKTFDEWNTEYTMTNGNVGFFGYDEATGAFKTPCIQAGTFLAQAVVSGEFGSFLNSELKSHTHTQNAHTHSWSGTTSSNGAHTHTRGTMDITGYVQGSDNTSSSFGGAFDYVTGLSKQYGFNSSNTFTTGFDFKASRSWTGATSSNGAHTHTVSGTTGSATPTINATGGSDTYPKHIRYPFFVVVSNVNAEEASQADWDNFVGNLDEKLNKSLSNIDEIGQAKFDAKVNKAGDTMTGMLEVQSATPTIKIRSTQFERDVAPSTSQGVMWYNCYDKNNNSFGNLGVEKNNDNSNVLKVQAFSADGTSNATIRVRAYADGSAGFNFPKCTTKATTTSSASDYKTAVVTQNYVNGYSWYRVWSDGWKEQGGWCNRGTNVTYLKAFSDNNYTLVASGLSASTNTGMAYNHVMPNAKTTTGFTGTPSNAVGLFWYACGY